MSLQACAEIVERGDPDRFLAAMASPVAARAVLFPLYAFNVEVYRAPWVTEEPMIAEMRLQWWRDVLEDIGQGKPPRPHEVTTPLAALLTGPTAATLDALVAARRWDIYKEPFADRAEFDAYIDATAGGLMWTAARLLGAPVAAEPLVRDLAYASGLANWLCAIPELEARGRYPLVDGRPEAVKDLAKDGLRRLHSARSRRAELVKSAAPALFSAWQAGPVLTMAARAPRRVSEGHLALSEFGRKGRLLLRGLSGRW